MSRIGKKVIELVDGSSLQHDTTTNTVIAKGKLGELKQVLLPFIKVNIEGNQVNLTIQKENDRFQAAMWGTARALINNMVEGVTKGFTKELELNGVGYKMDLSGQKLTIHIGYSHPVILEAPSTIKLQLNKNVLTGTSIDKQALGDFFTNLHNMKPADPYKHKGFKFPGRFYAKKVGKKLSK